MVSRSRTVNPPQGDGLVRVSVCASPYLYILGMKFDSKLIFEDRACGIVSRVKEWVFWGWLSVSLWTPLCCFVATTIRSHNPRVLFFSVWVCCWMSSSAFKVPGVFGSHPLPWSEFIVFLLSKSCCCSVYVVQG